MRNKLLCWAAAAFAVWLVIYVPHTAAHLARNLGVFPGTAAHGLAAFLAGL